jgi:multidrug efflux pump subunit AcrA (membrane-fusion protein)
MTGWAIFPNPDLALVPGLFARTRLPGSGRYAALLLPDQAIGSDQTQRFVLVVNDQHTVEYRKVEVGPMIDGLRVIRDGLKPEEWVIVNGVQRVRPGAKLEAQQQVGPKDQARPRAGEGAPRQTGGCCARRIDSPQSPPVWRA